MNKSSIEFSVLESWDDLLEYCEEYVAFSNVITKVQLKEYPPKVSFQVLGLGGKNPNFIYIKM